MKGVSHGKEKSKGDVEVCCRSLSTVLDSHSGIRRHSVHAVSSTPCGYERHHHPRKLDAHYRIAADAAEVVSWIDEACSEAPCARD